jgi:hypothetical protein
MNHTVGRADILLNSRRSIRPPMRNLFLLANLILASIPATAAWIDGVEVPESLTAATGGPPLLLNGAGVREKLFFDIYVGALYLPAKSSDADAILASPDPACVTMHFLYKEVGREKIVGAWVDGLAANHSAAEMQALRPQIDRFNALFRTVPCLGNPSFMPCWRSGWERTR